MSKQYRVGIMGVTGAVGTVMLRILEERHFPVAELKPLASARSVGKTVQYHGEDIPVQEMKPDSFKGLDIVLASAGASVSRQFVQNVKESGAVMIDNTSAFRMEADVPLVVPEVNPEDIFKHQGVIANPNCSTIIMLVAVNPLHRAARVKRILASTYQAVSGTGAKAIAELEQQTRQWAKGEKITHEVYPYPIAFNVLPHIDVFLENGYTKEEMKMMHETRKMLHDDSIMVSATAVRVPVFTSHSETIQVETEKKLTAAEAREILAKAPGVKVVDDPANKKYPLPLHTSGQDDVWVGRIREDVSHPRGLALWVVGDQLRKGAATNAVQIAEILINR
ncbi:aspartate-semialdehyde dehydrogenase [candidate division FCPU426 bacterium]|nr:aspartate-semialdehyde dehydrogenase [candidate division FCPU426 bacterium]